MCRISVVVPVYNAAGPLPGCAASVLAGAPQGLELILVDDGSTDGSAAICDGLAGQDARVRALHQPNGGASAARNAGLAEATGDYVAFVDADDRLLPGLWAAALPVLAAHRLDLYVFGVRPAVGAPEALPAGAYASPRALPNLPDLLDKLLVHGGALAAPYGKLYRRATLGGLQFDPALKVNEDFLFNAQFLARCGPLYFEPQPYYRYENGGAGSLSRRLRGDLLLAEGYTRPAFASALQALGLEPAQQQQLLQARQLHCALAQFGLLAGQKGRMPLGRRAALTRQVLAVPGARTALAAQYRADPNRLLALPYRACLALRLPGLLAAYCAIKSRFL